MQELLLVTNQRTRLRVTAFGGIVAGLLLGVGLSAAGGYVLYNKEHDAALVRETTLKATYEERLASVNAASKKKEDSFSCESLLHLARLQESDNAAVQELMAQFPVFKTDPYKELFVNLSTEVERQGEVAKTLRVALTAADVAKNVRCTAAATDADAPVLWSRGAVSFTRLGWKGLSHE